MSLHLIYVGFIRQLRHLTKEIISNESSCCKLSSFVIPSKKQCIREYTSCDKHQIIILFNLRITLLAKFDICHIILFQRFITVK